MEAGAFNPRMLPLMDMRGGAKYMQVAQRLVWLNAVCERFSIETELVSHDPEQGLWVSRATITLLSEQGEVLKRASDFGQESDRDFAAGALEKSVTKAVGRALALLGFGTAHALADVDAGGRVVDSPVAPRSRPAAPRAAMPFEVLAGRITASGSVQELTRLWSDHARSLSGREQAALARIAGERKAALAGAEPDPAPAPTAGAAAPEASPAGAAGGKG